METPEAIAERIIVENYGSDVEMQRELDGMNGINVDSIAAMIRQAVREARA